MKPLIPFLFIVQTALVALAGLSVANADVLAGLPIHGTTDSPALLLELGSEAAFGWRSRIGNAGVYRRSLRP